MVEHESLLSNLSQLLAERRCGDPEGLPPIIYAVRHSRGSMGTGLSRGDTPDTDWFDSSDRTNFRSSKRGHASRKKPEMLVEMASPEADTASGLARNASGCVTERCSSVRSNQPNKLKLV